MQFFKSLYLCFFLLAIAVNSHAQNIEVTTNATSKLSLDADSMGTVVIGAIHIRGNTKTKDYIIFREMQIKTGDTVLVSKLNEELQKARQQVYNTNLFLEVKFNIATTNDGLLTIEILVKERWYIFPLLKFQLVDRNINEWLQKYNGDLDRVVYGVKFTHYNLTGRRDLLRLTFLNGFTRNVSFSYFQPVSQKALNNGFSITGGYIQNREFIYKTSYDNKPLQFNNGSFSRKNIFVGIGYNFRNRILGSHAFNITYNHLTVVDSLLKEPYNPSYLNTTGAVKNYLDISYAYQYINANNAIYPLKGTTATIKILKRGLGWSGGVNMLYVEGTYNKFWDLKKNWFGSVQLSAKTTLPFNQPYINQRALGYGDANLRGLELHVVDGVAFGLMRTTIKKKLFTLNVPMPFKSDKYGKIPFTVFAKTFADAGFVYNQQKFQTNLSNRFLYTGGIGIDILSIYDVNLRIEYSFNQLNKNGLFLQAQSGL